MCCVWKKPFSKEETENLCFHWQVVQGKSWSIHVSGHFHRFLAHWRINGYNFTTLKIHGLDFTIVYCSLSYHVIYNGWHKAPGENRRVFLQRKVLQAIEKGLCFGSSPLLPFKSKFVHFLVKRSTRWIIGGKILLFEEQLASVPSHLLYGLLLKRCMWTFWRTLKISVRTISRDSLYFLKAMRDGRWVGSLHS